MLAPVRAVAALEGHPALEALAARVRAVVDAAYTARRAEVLSGNEVAELTNSALPKLSQAEAETPFGNVLAILDQGPKTATEWSLLGALWALSLRAGAAASSELIAEALWLTVHTPLAPLLFADAVLPPAARVSLWDAVVTSAASPLPAPGERLALAASLALSTSDECAAAAARLFDLSQDPAVKALLLPTVGGLKPLSGNISPARGRLRTTLLAITGALFVVSLWRGAARLLLGLQRRGTLTLTPSGIALKQSTVLFGKPLSIKERHLPFDQVTVIARETRYAGTALYLGVLCLAVGSYIGSGLLMDALRAPGGSPSLLGIGLLAIAVGVALDFVLFRFAAFKKGQARVLIGLRKGRGITLSGPELADADAWIARVTHLRAQT
jgi:hypothetical protein